MISAKILTLAAAIGIIGANSLALSPIAAAVARDFPNASPADVLICAAVFGLATAISALFLASQVDRAGADTTLRYSLLALIVAFAISTFAPTYVTLIVAQALAGLACGVALPSIYALAALVAPQGQEGKTIGMVLTGWTISLVGGVALSAMIADQFSWRHVYGGLSVLTAGLYLCTLRAKFQAPRSRNAPRSPLGALKVPGAPRTLFVIFAFMSAFYGLYGYLGAYVETKLHLGTTYAGMISLVYGVGFGLGTLADPLIDRKGAAKMTQPIFCALLLVYLVAAWASTTYAGFLAVALLWGFCQHLGLTLVVARVAALDRTKRGALLGLNSAVTYLAAFAGTLAFRPIYEIYGYSACAFAAAACIALAVIDGLLIRPPPPQ